MKNFIKALKDENTRERVAMWAMIIFAVIIAVALTVTFILTVTPIHVNQLGTLATGSSRYTYYTIGEYSDVTNIAVYCRGFRSTGNIKIVVTHKDGSRTIEYCQSIVIVEKSKK